MIRRCLLRLQLKSCATILCRSVPLLQTATEGVDACSSQLLHQQDEAPTTGQNNKNKKIKRDIGSRIRKLEAINVQMAVLRRRRQTIVREIRARRNAEAKSARELRGMMRLAADPKRMLLARAKVLGMISNMRSHRVVRTVPVTPRALFSVSATSRKEQRRPKSFETLSVSAREALEAAAAHNRAVVQRAERLAAEGSMNLTADFDKLAAELRWTAASRKGS
jgi:hypothetical protein